MPSATEAELLFIFLALIGITAELRKIAALLKTMSEDIRKPRG